MSLSLVRQSVRKPDASREVRADPRPEWIAHDGWRENLHAHDAGYLVERRRWKRLLAAAHPDRLATAAATPRSRRPWAHVRCGCGRSVKLRTSKQCHVCRCASAYAFKLARKQWEVWLDAADRWYADRQLAPPAWGTT